MTSILYYTTPPSKPAKCKTSKLTKTWHMRGNVNGFHLCDFVVRKMYLHLHLIKPEKCTKFKFPKTQHMTRKIKCVSCLQLNWQKDVSTVTSDKTNKKHKIWISKKNSIWMENECVPCFNCVDRKMYLQLHRIKPAKCTACDIQSDSDDVWSTRIPDKCWLDARAVRFYRIRGKFSPHLCCQGGKCNQNPWIWNLS